MPTPFRVSLRFAGLALLAAALLGCRPAGAAPGELFRDQFQRDQIGPVWTATDDPDASCRGHWWLRLKKLAQDANCYRLRQEYTWFQGTHITAGRPTWRDYIVTAKVNVEDDDGWGLILRYRDKDNYYRFLSVADRVNNGPFTRLQKLVGGKPPVTLAETKAAYGHNKTCVAQFSAAGNLLTVTIDGKVVLTARDDTFQAGQFGICTYACLLSVSEVVVTGEGEPLTAPSTTPPAKTTPPPPVKSTPPPPVKSTPTPPVKSTPPPPVKSTPTPPVKSPPTPPTFVPAPIAPPVVPSVGPWPPTVSQVAPATLATRVPADPADARQWPQGDVLWSTTSAPLPAPGKKPRVKVDLSGYRQTTNEMVPGYNARVSRAKEAMRLLYGPVTPEQTLAYERKWAPYYAFPTPEAASHLDRLTPLLTEALAARAGLAQAQRACWQSLAEAMVAAECGQSADVAAALAVARQQRSLAATYEDALRNVAVALRDVGNPPNPMAAAAKRRAALAQQMADTVSVLREAKGQPPATPSRNTPATPTGTSTYWILTSKEVDPTVTLDLPLPDRRCGPYKGGATEGFVWAENYSHQGMWSWTPLPLVLQQDAGKPPHFMLSVRGRWAKNPANQTGFVRSASAAFSPVGQWTKGVDIEPPYPGQPFEVEKTLRREASPVVPESPQVNKRTIWIKAGMMHAEISLAGTYERLALTPDQFRARQQAYDQDEAKRQAQIKAMNSGGAPVVSSGAGTTGPASTPAAPPPPDPSVHRADRVAYFRDSARWFAENLRRDRADLARATDPGVIAELQRRILWSEANMQDALDQEHSAQTGEFRRTRTALDDFNTAYMLRQGAEEARRMAEPTRLLRGIEAQIRLLPEYRRDRLQAQVRNRLDGRPISTREIETLRQLATDIRLQVSDYWERQSTDATTRAANAQLAEDIFVGTVKQGAMAVAMVGTGGALVSMGLTGARLWAAEAAAGAALGGSVGYVEGGPSQAAHDALAWAGPVGASASAALDTWQQTGSAGAGVSEAAKGALFGLLITAGGRYLGRPPGLPVATPAVPVALTRPAEFLRFQADVAAARKLVQGMAQAEQQLALAKQASASQKVIAELVEQAKHHAAAVNASYEAKLILKNSGPSTIVQRFNQRLDTVYRDVEANFRQRLAQLGYNEHELQFSALRNPSSAGTASMDLDKALRNEEKLLRNGRQVPISRAQREFQQAWEAAYEEETRYRGRPGFSPQASAQNVTTSAFEEAFTKKLVNEMENVAALRNAGLSVPIDWSRLAKSDVHRMCDVMRVKMETNPLQGVSRAVEGCRALHKEMKSKVLDYIDWQIAQVAKKKDPALLLRLRNQRSYWADVESRLASIATVNVNPGVMYDRLKDLQRFAGGQDVFDLSDRFAAFIKQVSDLR